MPEMTIGKAVAGIAINSGIVTVTMTEGATMNEAKASQIVKDAGFTLEAFERPK